eukprot:3101515-Amphidinium_carterae.1
MLAGNTPSSRPAEVSSKLIVRRFLMPQVLNAKAIRYLLALHALKQAGNRQDGFGEAHRVCLLPGFYVNEIALAPALVHDACSVRM